HAATLSLHDALPIDVAARVVVTAGVGRIIAHRPQCRRRHAVGAAGRGHRHWSGLCLTAFAHWPAGAAAGLLAHLERRKTTVAHGDRKSTRLNSSHVK